MSLDEIISQIKPWHAELTRLGVARLVLFGPPVQQGFIRKRELDLIYQPQAPVTFDEYHKLKRFLEVLLQCRVDLAIADLEKVEVGSFADPQALVLI